MKSLIVMRGCPGSGKSTKAGSFGGLIFSTDDYFVREGVYRFNPGALATAHLWNQNRAMLAMIEGAETVVIDNTNCQAWEPQVYVRAGIALNYGITIVEPSTPWAFDPEELARKNTHGVPLETIRSMLARWEYDLTVEKILKSCAPRS